MNKQEFLSELQEIMMLEEALSEDSELDALQAYDSMTHLTLLSLFEEEFGKELEAQDLIDAKTVNDLLVLAGLGD
jgi:acyl carrier protein|tara:strand:- start:825 stop:1049 length:225 start_codon:yes stop_codon:yes gene_type:complete